MAFFQHEGHRPLIGVRNSVFGRAVQGTHCIRLYFGRNNDQNKCHVTDSCLLSRTCLGPCFTYYCVEGTQEENNLEDQREREKHFRTLSSSL